MNLPSDPKILQDILTGVTTNALWSLIARTGTKALAALDQNLRRKSANVFTEAAAAVIAEFAKTRADQSKLKAFLSAPETESIVRQIYATKAVQSDWKTIQVIEQEFLAALAKYLDVGAEKAKPASECIFQALISECDALFSAAIEANLLTAHESKSTVRHRRLLDEIAAVKRTLDLLTSARELDVGAILQFEDRLS